MAGRQGANGNRQTARGRGLRDGGGTGSRSDAVAGQRRCQTMAKPCPKCDRFFWRRRDRCTGGGGGAAGRHAAPPGPPAAATPCEAAGIAIVGTTAKTVASRPKVSSRGRVLFVNSIERCHISGGDHNADRPQKAGHSQQPAKSRHGCGGAGGARRVSGRTAPRLPRLTRMAPAPGAEPAFLPGLLRPLRTVPRAGGGRNAAEAAFRRPPPPGCLRPGAGS